jgi:hypothetical protein
MIRTAHHDELHEDGVTDSEKERGRQGFVGRASAARFSLGPPLGKAPF